MIIVINSGLLREISNVAGIDRQPTAHREGSTLVDRTHLELDWQKSDSCKIESSICPF